MLPLGTAAPGFRLPDTDGKMVSLDDFKGSPALLVAFICNHCPYVKHVRHELARLGKQYQEQGVAVVGISSNDVLTHPDDSPAMMAREKAEVGYGFPYLYDETQEVALRLSSRVHAGLLRVRPQPEARLSRPARREPAGQPGSGHGQRPSISTGLRPRRHAGE